MLRAAARALGAFCDPQLPLWGRADLVRSRLVDQLSRRWQRHMSRIVGVLRGGGCGVVGLYGVTGGYMGLGRPQPQSSSLDEEELFNMAATLRRLAAIFA